MFDIGKQGAPLFLALAHNVQNSAGGTVYFGVAQCFYVREGGQIRGRSGTAQSGGGGGQRLNILIIEEHLIDAAHQVHARGPRDTDDNDTLPVGTQAINNMHEIRVS
jgi:hypothetical protein